MPIGIVELGEIVRISDVLGGEPWTETARQLDDLVRLQLLHARQKGEDVVESGHSLDF
jgi:DNA replicative helicase MCM subunit Mcm2 (Cdc46/Mcm family)